ncbi:MAG: hypothetical protein EOO39_00495 [Cytophagaceae bacterium]|nr:MAG: hypothetical protein EOO39_00495 [Cytophagaceae bacterium]
MPRPILIDFRDSGVYIDPSVYCTGELKVLHKKWGIAAIEALVLLYAYRTPINPYDTEEARQTRALRDVNQTYKVQLKRPLTSDLFETPEFTEAVARFIVERYDPAFEEYLVFEEKRNEGIRALKETPYREKRLFVAKPKKKLSKKETIRRAQEILDGLRLSFDDEEDDVEQDENFEWIDNSKLIQNMTTTHGLVTKNFEDIRKVVLKQNATGNRQRAANFTNRET